jgi:hypothetical protein
VPQMKIVRDNGTTVDSLIEGAAPGEPEVCLCHDRISWPWHRCAF